MSNIERDEFYAGRMLSAVDSGNNINYVTGATYDASNALTAFVSGQTNSFAGITNSFSFNKRLQQVNMSASSPSQTLFSIGYNFHLGNGNNGNVYGITNYKDAPRNQAFTYDALNRLTSAQNAVLILTPLLPNNNREYLAGSRPGSDLSLPVNRLQTHRLKRQTLNHTSTDTKNHHALNIETEPVSELMMIELRNRE